jgi:hypothetical protein
MVGVGTRLNQFQRSRAGHRTAANLRRLFTQNEVAVGRAVGRMGTTLPSLNLVAVSPTVNPVSKNKLIKNIFRAFRNRKRPSSALVPSSDIKPEMLKNMAAGKLLGAALLRGNASRTMRNYKMYMLSRFGSTVHPDDRPASAAASSVPSAAAAPAVVRDIASLLNRARFGKKRRYAGGRPKQTTPAPVGDIASLEALRLQALIPSTNDPYRQLPLIAKSNAKKTIKAFILRKAIQNRKGAQIELDARQNIIALFRRKKEQELIQDLRVDAEIAKQEKALDKISNAFSVGIAKQNLKKLREEKTLNAKKRYGLK